MSKQAQRNAGAISLIVEKVRSELLQAVDTEGFFGDVILKAHMFNQDISEYELYRVPTVKVK